MNEIKLINDFKLAITNGNLEMVQNLIAGGADVNQKYSRGETALMLAVDKGHPAIVEELINKGAVVDFFNEYGQSALIIAAANGHFERVEKLNANQAPEPFKNLLTYNQYSALQAHTRKWGRSIFATILGIGALHTIFNFCYDVSHGYGYASLYLMLMTNSQRKFFYQCEMERSSQSSETPYSEAPPRSSGP